MLHYSTQNKYQMNDYPFIDNKDEQSFTKIWGHENIKLSKDSHYKQTSLFFILFFQFSYFYGCVCYVFKNYFKYLHFKWIF